MAIFVTPRYEVAQAVAAIWGLQLGNTTMTDVLDLVKTHGLQAVVSSAFNASYGAASDEAVADAFVANLGITGDAAEGAAEYVVSQLDGAADRGAVLATIAKAFGALSTTDTSVAALVSAFNAKVAAAVSYSALAGTPDVSIDGLPSATSFELTTSRDVLTGTAGNDVFVADVFDNQNTFQSGDTINGGGGFDVLEATLGLSSAFAILPRTSSVEAVYIRSQANNSSGNGGDNNPAEGPVADGNTDDNTVDAELMSGVQQWWNTDSRADLVIEDIRIADNQITKDIAIGWANADPSSMQGSGVDKVDYEVYFSPESLRKAGDTTSNAIQLTVGNQVRTADFDPDAPLKDIPYTAVQFLVDGESVILQLDLTGIETYDDLWETFSEVFAEAKAENELLADVEIERIVDGDSFFSRDGVLRQADVIQLTKANGEISPATPGWLADGGLPPNNAFSANVEQGAAIVTSDLITSTVFLDNVGRESEAGDLVIGSMSTRTGVERFDITVLNNDNTSGTYTSSGSWVGSMASTNNFLREVLAKNDAAGSDEPDYLYVGTGMDDENNNLTTIRQTFLSTQSTEAGFAKYQAAVDAALLRPDGLTDVRLFDASAMSGQVKVGASITQASIQKYQDLVDTQADDGFEDVNFEYSTGSANDSVNLVLDDSLWDNDSSSSVIPGRHDFTFEVNGNAGNDHLQVVISGEDDGQTPAEGGNVNWYINQMINNNITVNGGAGDDTIRTPGAGDMKLNGGAGNDTIYTDNTGDLDEYGGDVDGNPYDADGGRFNDGRATWVFNAENNGLYDLRSETAASVLAVNAQLTVDFRGFTKSVFIGNSENALSNVRITDLSVNQAIKDAINNDAVLSKLLVAEDGPGRTLIVRSLIDGERAEQDLSVSFSNKALTTAQAAVSSITLFNPASAATSMVNLLNGYTVSDFAVDIGTLDGDDSSTPSDNVIEGGTGNDVIVLSTTGYGDGNDTSDDEYFWTLDAEFTPSKNILGSNEIVQYTGFNNGTDTIVNFDTTYDETVYGWNGAGAEIEVVQLTFSASDGSPAAQTIIFDGQTITLSAPATQGVIPADDVAYQFVQQLNSSNWEAEWVIDSGLVILTRTSQSGGFGEVDDLVAGDFTGTYTTDGSGTVTPLVLNQGTNGVFQLATNSEFTVTFNVAGTAADADGTFSFDGVNTAYLEGDGAITLAQKIEADAAAYLAAGWVVSRDAATTPNAVTFTAVTPGAGEAIGTAADFDLGSNVIVGTIEGTLGTDEVEGAEYVVVAAGPGNGFDFLDFRAYDAVGVVVNGVTLRDIAGDGITVGSAAPNNTTYNYIKMTESTTNAGEYKIELVTVDDDTPATPDVVQLIGVADFGDTNEPVFVAENFII